MRAEGNCWPGLLGNLRIAEGLQRLGKGSLPRLIGTTRAYRGLLRILLGTIEAYEALALLGAQTS